MPIGEALYSGYKLFLLFNNAITYSIYTSNALQVTHMNKESGGQQFFLRPGWFIGLNQEVITQEISTVITNPSTNKSTLRQKDIQRFY